MYKYIQEISIDILQTSLHYLHKANPQDTRHHEDVGHHEDFASYDTGVGLMKGLHDTQPCLEAASTQLELGILSSVTAMSVALACLRTTQQALIS